MNGICRMTLASALTSALFCSNAFAGYICSTELVDSIGNTVQYDVLFDESSEGLNGGTARLNFRTRKPGEKEFSKVLENLPLRIYSAFNFVFYRAEFVNDLTVDLSLTNGFKTSIEQKYSVVTLSKTIPNKTETIEVSISTGDFECKKAN